MYCKGPGWRLLPVRLYSSTGTDCAMSVMQHNVPLYQQIYDDIKTLIKKGEYQSGERIPSEPELSHTYSVSRITVRRAIEDLCTDGYLIKQQGRGTFVGSPRVERKFSQAQGPKSFADTCIDNGIVSGAHVIDTQIVPARPHELEFFGLSEGELLLYVHRVRTADGLAVCDENVFIPYEWANPLMGMSWRMTPSLHRSSGYQVRGWRSAANGW